MEELALTLAFLQRESTGAVGPLGGCGPSSGSGADDEAERLARLQAFLARLKHLRLILGSGAQLCVDQAAWRDGGALELARRQQRVQLHVHGHNK